MLGKFQIDREILTIPNKINSKRKPKFAKEKIKKKKQKKGVIVTNLDNNNITRFEPSYRIPLRRIKRKRISMSDL